MNAYQVDNSGVVNAAAKVQIKVAELQAAHEELAVAKIMAALSYGRSAVHQVAAPVQIVEANVKAVRNVRFKKTGYTTATLQRKKLLLYSIRRKSCLSEAPSFEFVQEFIKTAGIEERRFDWCKTLSQISILGVYNYVRDNY